MSDNKRKNNHRIIFDHIGFTSFLFFLLIAPQIPIYIASGIEGSNISLGFVGFFIWFLLCPNYLLKFPKQAFPLPIIILILFAFYAFLISLVSANIVSIASGAQFLFYVVVSSIFFKAYLLKIKSNGSFNMTLKIFFTIMVVYALGVLISVLTGPIYPWQTIYTLRPWGDMWIRQGVGFSEGQSVAAGVLIVFAAAAIYLYRSSKVKKIILILLALFALFSTLSRSPIIAFLIAIATLLFLEYLYAFFLSGKVKKKLLVNSVYLVFILFFLSVAGFFLYFIDKNLVDAILSGFGFGNGDALLTDLETRLFLWSGGISNWRELSLPIAIFGGGFHSSMIIIPETGAWLTIHNFFITILVEFGIVGFGLIILFFILSIATYLRAIFVKSNFNATSVAHFGFISLLAIMIHNLTGEFLYSPVLISLVVLITMLSLIQWKT